MDFAKAVRIARSIAGYSQKELADRANVDASLISLVESGKRQPSAATLVSIGKGLNLPMHLLTMLGAEESDLRSISAEDFQTLTQSIARLVLGYETAIPRSTDRTSPASGYSLD